MSSTKRQVVDIPPIKTMITEHRVYQVQYQCGNITTGDFPDAVNAPVQYGDNLSTRQYIPYQRIPELLKCISNISISEGTVFNMLNKVADRLYPLYENITQNIENAKVVGSDETGTNVINSKYWIWTWQAETEHVLQFRPAEVFLLKKIDFHKDFQMQFHFIKE